MEFGIKDFYEEPIQFWIGSFFDYTPIRIYETYTSYLL